MSQWYYCQSQFFTELWIMYYVDETRLSILMKALCVEECPLAFTHHLSACMHSVHFWKISSNLFSIYAPLNLHSVFHNVVPNFKSLLYVQYLWVDFWYRLLKHDHQNSCINSAKKIEMVNRGKLFLLLIWSSHAI